MVWVRQVVGQGEVLAFLGHEGGGVAIDFQGDVEHLAIAVYVVGLQHELCLG